MGRRRIRRILLVSLVVCLAFAVAGAAVTVYIDGESVALPAPSGPYAIGRLSYDWVDPSRHDPFAANPAVRRELLVWIWYPAVRSSEPPGRYLPGAWGRLLAPDKGPIPAARLENLRAYAVDHVAAAPGRAPYPVLIMEPGVGRVPLEYTAIADDLASHGYVVVGVTPTESASAVVFPDGRVIRATPGASEPDQGSATAYRRWGNAVVGIWARDIAFVLTRIQRLAVAPQGTLASHLDLRRVGVFGHSLGGAAAIEFCHRDRRCTAAADLDGDPFGAVTTSGLRQPVLFMHSDQGPCDYAGCAAARQAQRSILAHAARGSVDLTIHGTLHNNFTDDALFSRFPLPRSLLLLGPINGRRGLMLTNTSLQTFFDRSLSAGEDRARPLLFPVASANGRRYTGARAGRPDEAFGANVDSLHILREAPQGRSDKMLRSPRRGRF